jgi:hypothetical protein
MIGLQYGIQIGVRNGGVPVHGFSYNLPNGWKTQLPVQKASNGDLVCCIHHSGQCATDLASPARKV